MSEKRFILKRSNAISSNYCLGERVYDTVLKKELYNLEIVDLLNELNDERMLYKTTIDKRIVELEDENEQLQKKYDNLNSAIEKTANDMNEKRIYGREDFDVFQRITDYVEELE